MQLQHASRRSGRKPISVARHNLTKWGFDLGLFRNEAEIEFAAHYVEDNVVDTDVFKRMERFGVTPAWIVGESGPFIGIDGLRKLATAFELGNKLGKDTAAWLQHLTSVEVIKMLPDLYN